MGFKIVMHLQTTF